MSEAMNYKLPPLPCPFCGNESKVIDDLITFHVECSVCGSTGAVSSYESGAIEVWNRRAALEAQGVPCCTNFAAGTNCFADPKANCPMLASAPPAPQAEELLQWKARALQAEAIVAKFMEVQTSEEQQTHGIAKE